MRYVIHSAPSRQWYVDKFLVPSMLKQGIDEKEIVVKCDTAGKGNLFACMDAFMWCGQNTSEGSWHIQDDVVICRDFAKRTREFNDGVVAGCAIKGFGPDWTAVGSQPISKLWYSFQCIRIPDEMAGECALWFYHDVVKRYEAKYYNRIQRKKHDDDFFLFFLEEKYPKKPIYNLAPNLVDHIDYMIGGSLINKERNKEINRSAYWNDEALVRDLEDMVLAYRQQNGL